MGHILRGNFLLKQVTLDKTEGRIEVARKRRRRCKQLPNDLKEKRGYQKLKEKALYRIPWQTCFGRGCRKNTE